jgi:hypothetical protein
MHKKWHHHFSLSLKNLILNNFEILLDFCFRAPTGNEVITYKGRFVETLSILHCE